MKQQADTFHFYMKDMSENISAAYLRIATLESELFKEQQKNKELQFELDKLRKDSETNGKRHTDTTHQQGNSKH